MTTQPKSTEKYSYWLIMKPEEENKNSICINSNQIDQ